MASRQRHPGRLVLVAAFDPTLQPKNPSQLNSRGWNDAKGFLRMQHMILTTVSHHPSDLTR
jgi:hypothetical protein